MNEKKWFNGFVAAFYHPKVPLLGKWQRKRKR